MLDVFPVVAVALGTFFASRARGTALAPFVSADEDDDLGLRKLFRWGGDLWGMIGPVALIIFPILTLISLGVAALILVLVERRVEAIGDQAKVPCAHCGNPIHPSALACPSCRSRVLEPRAVGLLGWPKATPADIAAQPYQLVAVKRCPVCATRFGHRGVRQTCEACGHRLMDDPAFAEAYIGSIDRRVPLACLACFALGLIPLVGVIPGVIAYRLTIVAPFRRYMPMARGILLRWAVRLVVLVLVACQWVPVAGALAIPAMALISYAVYRTAYRRLALAA